MAAGAVALTVQVGLVLSVPTSVSPPTCKPPMPLLSR